LVRSLSGVTTCTYSIHEYEDKSSLVSPARRTLDEDPAPFVVELAAI
jgi:hypothetical protein